MLSFLSRLAPYRKFVVAAAGFILAGVAQSGVLPVDSSWSRLIAAVLALGSLYGIWRFPNAPLPSGPLVRSLPPSNAYGSATAATAPSMAQVRSLTGETQTGGSTTASGAATVKLNPPQPPTPPSAA